jgi:hypothetical protein
MGLCQSDSLGFDDPISAESGALRFLNFVIRFLPLSLFCKRSFHSSRRRSQITTDAEGKNSTLGILIYLNDIVVVIDHFEVIQSTMVVGSHSGCRDDFATQMLF